MSTTEATDTVQITGLSHDGRGVGRSDGKALFVAGALPGETVRVGRRRCHRRHDEAELAAILEPAAERAAPECPHFGVCGGCSLQHMAAGAQLAAKERRLLETLERIGHVRPEELWPALTGPAYGYRRRARFGVRCVGKSGRVLVGFREANTRRITDARHCPAMVPAGENLPGRLRKLIVGLSVKRSISQVDFAAGDQKAALVFRATEAPGPDDEQRLVAFGRDHDVAIWLQTDGPASLRRLHGTPVLTYELPQFSVTLRCLPVDFMQINAAVNRKLVSAVVERLALRGDERVLELFAGIGNFSLALARQAGEVVAVEGNPALVERAGANARANGLDNIRHAEADLAAPQNSPDWATGRFDAVLLDPPRRGARELIPLVRRLAPGRIVYVSCDPATLARDAALLGKAGWHCAGAGVADMFPQTAHVESIALFKRDGHGARD